MAVHHLIIDGYNLMHAAGASLGVPPHASLEQRRQHLLNALARQLNRTARETTTVVFDAQSAGHHYPTTAAIDGMRVIYTSHGVDADSTIEQLIEASHAPRQLLIVSSDHRLQLAAKRRKAQFITSRDFASSILDDHEPSPEHHTPPRPSAIPTTTEPNQDLLTTLDEFLQKIVPPKK